jgi:hypothetical protein
MVGVPSLRRESQGTRLRQRFRPHSTKSSPPILLGKVRRWRNYHVIAGEEKSAGRVSTGTLQHQRANATQVLESFAAAILIPTPGASRNEAILHAQPVGKWPAQRFPYRSLNESRCPSPVGARSSSPALFPHLPQPPNAQAFIPVQMPRPMNRQLPQFSTSGKPPRWSRPSRIRLSTRCFALISAASVSSSPSGRTTHSSRKTLLLHSRNEGTNYSCRQPINRPHDNHNPAR